MTLEAGVGNFILRSRGGANGQVDATAPHRSNSSRFSEIHCKARAGTTAITNGRLPQSESLTIQNDGSFRTHRFRCFELKVNVMTRAGSLERR